MISEHINRDKTSVQTTQAQGPEVRAEMEGDYESNMVDEQNQNYQDSDDSDEESVSSLDSEDRYPPSRTRHSPHTNDDKLFRKYHHGNFKKIPGSSTFLDDKVVWFAFVPRIVVYTSG